MKQRLSKTILSPKEADRRIQNLFQAITVHTDNINYWFPKIGKELEFLDVFILGTDKIKTPEEFIKLSQNKIEELRWKIYNDYARFVEVRNKVY